MFYPIILINEYTYQNITIKDFKIATHPTNDQEYIVALSNGTPIGRQNNILDISTTHKLYIFDSFKENINDLRKCEIKFVCIVDITDFPIIKSYIDDTDIYKINKNDGSLFNGHLATLWNNYSNSHVITIITNLHRSHIDVQLLPFGSNSTPTLIYNNIVPINQLSYLDEIMPIERRRFSDFDLTPLSSLMFNSLS